MNVPRGTPARVFEVSLPKWQHRALIEARCNRARLPMLAANSRVHPGTFEGLDLESGRLQSGTVDQVRARHEFDSGNTRVVTVMPLYTAGDLLWVRGKNGRRARSEFTLRVRRVTAARLQDISDVHAMLLGVQCAPVHGKNESARETFREVWDQWRLRGREPWDANQWCWSIEFDALRVQVDKLLAAGHEP